MVRASLSLLLECFDDFEKVGEARDGAEAVRMCRELQPDVVLMAFNLPEIDGIEVSRLMREACGRTRVIILTSSILEREQEAALRAEVSAYLPKGVAAEEILATIRSVVR